MARFAISDIHGCLNSLKRLLFNKIKVSKKDTLFLLGDYINKGPDSKGVLDFIAELQTNGFEVRCIRGNHDQMLLDVRKGNVAGSWTKEMQKMITLKSFHASNPFDIPAQYMNQIASMPLFISLDNFLLVHAGFYTGIHDPFLDKVAMMNIKNFAYQATELMGKKIFHGHVPRQLEAIRKITAEDNVVNIDGGCVYYTSKGYGNLIGIDIDTMELFVQPNADQPYEVMIKE